MDKFRFTVLLGESCHERTYSNEELKFLTGSGVPELIEFRKLIGLWDNFRVATGMNSNAWTVKDRVQLLEATRALSHRMEVESELFAITFSLKCPGSLSRGSSKCWIQFTDEKSGHLLAYHPGQLYFEWREDPMADHEIYDVRQQAIKDGEICGARIYTKPNSIRWPHFLSELATFLQSSDIAEARIRHDAAPKA
jgi:hypothetical protein